MTRVYRNQRGRRAFTILELLVVIAIIGILLSMAVAILPDASNEQTKSLVMRLNMAIGTYKDNFYVFPRVRDNGYLDDSPTPALQGPFNLYEILTANDMVRRDGKYVDQLFDSNSELDAMDFSGDTYFVDAWGNKLVYYSGDDILEGINDDTTLHLASMMVATGILEDSTNISNLRGRYKPDRFYFLGSAGEDGQFGYQVVKGSDSDPNAYTYSDTSAFSEQGAKNHNSDPLFYDELDDLWNTTLGSSVQ